MANDESSDCATMDDSADSADNNDSNAEGASDETSKRRAAALANLTEGSLVWAKLKGFSYWPAVVTIDPMDAVAVKVGEGPKGVSRVHVHFLAYENQRAWVPETNIMEFHGLPHFRKLEASARGPQRKDFVPTPRLRALFDKAVEHASDAMPLDNLARLDKLGFVYVPVDKQPVPTAAARKIVSPPPAVSSNPAVAGKKRKRMSSSVSSRMSTSSSSSLENEIKLSEAGDVAQEEPVAKKAKVITKKKQKKRGRKPLVRVQSSSGDEEEIRDMNEPAEDNNGAHADSPDEGDGGDDQQPRPGSLWGRMCGYPFWPSFVTKSADGSFSRVLGKRRETHVQFFNWNNESGWVSKTLPWCDLDALKGMAKRAPKTEARDYAPPASKAMEKKWMRAVGEAQSTAHLNRHQRISSLVVTPKKKTPPKKMTMQKPEITEMEISALTKIDVKKKANGRPRAKEPSTVKSNKAATLKENKSNIIHQEKPCPKRHKLNPPSERNWPVEDNDDEGSVSNLTNLLSASDLPPGWSVKQNEEDEGREEFHSPDGSTFRSYEDIVRHLFDQNVIGHPRRKSASVCGDTRISDCSSGQGWLISEVDRHRHPLIRLTEKSAAGALDGRVQLFRDPALPNKWMVKRVFPWPPQLGAPELVFESPKRDCLKLDVTEHNYSSKLEVAEVLEPSGHPAVELEHLVRRIELKKRSARLFLDLDSDVTEELLAHPILGRALVKTFVDMTHLPDVFLAHKSVRVQENDNETVFTDAVTNEFIAKKILYD